MSQIEAAIANQEQLVEEMERLLTSFKKTGRDKRTADYIKRKLDALEEYWNEFQANHEQLCKYDLEESPYIKHSYFESAEEVYNKVKLHFKQYLATTPRPSPKIETDQPQPRTPQPGTSTSDRPIVTTAGPSTKSQGVDSKTTDLLRKQESNFRAFSRTTSNMDLEAVTEKWEFQDLLRQLESRWSAIDTLHWELDSMINGTEVYEQYEHSFTANERKYNFVKKSINSKLWSVSHREKSTPQIEIPIFHGNYYQWMSFKDLFTETIHSNPSLSHAQKMQFLKSKVRGEAERLIQHLQISSENYNVCWEILNNRYNNKKLIFTSHMNILMSLPVIQTVSMKIIKRIHDTTLECLNAIKNLGVDISTWDPILVHILSQKLDPETHSDYLESLKQPRELPTLQEFLSFLESKFTAMESAIPRGKQDAPQKPVYQKLPSASGSKPQQGKLSYHKQSFSANKVSPNANKQVSNNYYTTKCPVCEENHGIYYCQKFLNMPDSNKIRTVEKHNFCKNCLISHNGKTCTSDKRCRHCGEFHNSILHEAYINSSSAKAKVEPKSSTLVSQHHNTPEILLATAMIKVQARDGTYITMRALIDQGSQLSLITENAAQLLKLNRKHYKGTVSGIGTKESSCKGMTNITFTSSNNNYLFNTDTAIMKSLIKNLPNQSFPKPSWAHLEGLELADSEFYISRPVQILLGADVYSNIILEGICRGEHDMPIAQQTRLGWILCGGTKTLQCNVMLNSLDDIQRFWEVEDISEETSISAEDQYCIEFYKNTTTRKSDGRYEVRIPFKPNFESEIGESKHIAITQFRQLEKKFEKNLDMSEKYKSFMNEYISLRHLQPAIGNMKPDCFLPHHCVTRAESTTTSQRTVFNASAKMSNGKTLNDFMFRGPNLQQDLQILILKWRQFKYAFTADIEKMFRQIWVHSDDQRFQKIFWRDSPTKLLQEYQLTTVTYGTKSAPFLAMMTLKQLANDEQNHYDDTVIQTLKHCFFMDDLLQGQHSISSAKSLQKDLIDLLKSGGFNLRKWASNSPELLSDVNKDELNQVKYDFKQAESTKTLGLRWNSQQDTFTFDWKLNSDLSVPTKRMLLSDISRLFDPLGWLSPLTVKLKLIFQSTWASNVDWDDKVPQEIYSEWVKIKSDIQNLSKIEIPRWINTVEKQTIQLHGFSDSSIKAYAAVIYCKVNNNIVLVVGKSRIVPVNKNISIPRLELAGAQLLSKLMYKVKACLSDYSPEVYGWTDSQVVLAWIQGDESKWKAVVSNRVKQIKEVISADSWRYVKSEENPADCASRGLFPSQLINNQLWWYGPSWLPTFAEQESKNITFETDEETKTTAIQVQAQAVVKQTPEESIINRILNKHNFSKSTRILAWVHRFIAKKQDRKMCPYLTVSELKRAKLSIITHHQRDHFFEEISKLQTGSSISSKSKLLSLNPFLDEAGTLRVGGRLRHAQISEEMKHPVIIANDTRLSELIVEYAHNLTYHGGARLTTSFIRKQYWIIGGNRYIKKRLRRCVVCRRFDSSKQHQLMGDLPRSRSNISPRAFYNTGVDFTGFVMIKANKGRGIKTTKGYIAVFVCMATKAIHLELVTDLSTSAFLAALRRMAARRGTPRHIFSDNGTNFVGASNILQKEYDELHQVFGQEFMSEISEMNIEWHFNAPSWPSGNGLCEAAVKSLKHHLKRVVGEQKLTYEEYSTLLTQLEACLNSRPLCPLSEDPDNLDYLTPAHFLTGGAVLNVIDTERDLRTRWNLTQRIFQDIWNRWRSEYLTQLTTRSKWRQTRENIKINDIVLIHDDNLPAGKWPMGRVTEVHPGKDNLVRVVTLKTKSGYIKRPIVKLSVLPIHDEQESITSQTNVTINNNIKTRTKQKLPFSYITMALLYFMLLIFNVHGSYNITKLETDALFFDRVSKMNLVRDEWKIITYYDMYPFWQGMTAFQKYSQQLEQLCSNTRGQTHCNVIISQLQHGFSELEYYNLLILSQQGRTRARTRRGLINGVGYIANSLFGILDERFAERYQQDINRIRLDQHYMSSLWKNQTSIIEAEYNLLKRAGQSIDKEHKIINQHIMSLEKAATKMNLEMKTQFDSIDFSLGVIAANNMLQNLKNIQNTIIDAVTDIYHGRFNIHLLAPEQLRDELGIIASQLSTELALPIDIQTELEKIYKLLTVRSRITAEYCIFEIKLPLISRDIYEIFKLIPIPKQSVENMMYIVPKSEYAAINLRKDSYVTITENELNSCFTDTDLFLCRLKKPVNHLNDYTDLCKIDKSNSCSIVTEPCQNQWQDIRQINKYLYFCCDYCSPHILCEDQASAEKLTHSGIISIDQGCLIKTESSIIYSHSFQTSSMKIIPEIEIPLIAPINHLLNITFPKENITNESDILQNQQLLEEIHEKIKHVKDNQDSIDNNIAYHNIHHYSVIYVMVSIIIIGVVVYIYRCVKQRPSSPGAEALVTPVRPSLSALVQAVEAPESTRSAPRKRSVKCKCTCDSESVELNSISVSEKSKSVRKLDSYTSPQVRKPVFTVSENLV